MKFKLTLFNGWQYTARWNNMINELREKMSNSKVLVVSHGHPDLSKGGAEVAAYNLYSEYKKEESKAYF
ncbi:hypothetical protein P4S68_07815 [Pseudoalteromonas sp. Hal099]